MYIIDVGVNAISYVCLVLQIFIESSLTYCIYYMPNPEPFDKGFSKWNAEARFSGMVRKKGRLTRNHALPFMPRTFNLSWLWQRYLVRHKPLDYDPTTLLGEWP